jgi:hypothetical protein
MFKVAINPSYFAPVDVQIPGATKQTFDCEFKRMAQDEIDALMQKVKAGDLTDADICRHVVVGWKGIQDNDGDIQFSITALDDVLNIFPLARCIAEAFLVSLAGSRSKN